MTTIVMTGVTRGIGEKAVRQIISSTSDLTLILLARNAKSLSWIFDEAAADAVIHIIEVDLDKMSAVAEAASQVKDVIAKRGIAHPHALVLNAGVQHVDACTPSKDGIEDTFAVNVVANHILIRMLAPHISEGGRVVVTVSDTHFGDLKHNLGMVPGPVWRAPDLLAEPGTARRPHSVSAGRIAYSTSKLANIYQVHEYAREYPDLIIAGYNPGFVPGTGLARHAGRASRFVMAHLSVLMIRTPIASSIEAAGQNLVNVAMALEGLTTGSYINRDKMESSSPESYDPQREVDLISYLDSLTQKLLR